MSTAYDAESKYGIQYTRGSNWNPYAVTYVKEYYSNGTIVQYGQEFSVTNTFGEKTEYRYSGPDSINGNADDIIVTYLLISMVVLQMFIRRMSHIILSMVQAQ